MRTLILPDIHTKFGLAESIIEKEAPDETVFIGDYFDDWDDGIEIAHQTATWLKESMSKPNRIHLLGNHDNSYVNPAKYMCSGYSAAKKMAIDDVGIAWSQLRHYVYVGDWLVTHAGLSNDFFEQYAKDDEEPIFFLQRMANDKKLKETLYSISSARGGRDEYGGILWCDEREFEDIPGIQQIFGHTVGDYVRKGEYHFCIDTALNHYAIYDHDKSEMIINDTSDKLLFAYEDGET